MKAPTLSILRVSLAIGALCAGQALPQTTRSRIDPAKTLDYYHAVSAEATAGAGAVASSTTSVLSNAANWLLTQQQPSGLYPLTVGAPATTDTQGATARGMLVAYDATRDVTFLNSAIVSGDSLLADYPQKFSDGDPDFATTDALFLEELSVITGDAKYSGFAQTHFWDKLTAGVFGEANDLDAAEFAASAITYNDCCAWVSLQPWYVASPAVAAHLAEEIAIRDAFMAGVVGKLEAMTTDSITNDLYGIASSIWASKITGINLDPIIGRWADFNSTADFVNFLVSYQRPTGDWPYDTSARAATHVGDVSVTSLAVLALRAWDSFTYASRITSGTNFIKNLQQTNGQILTNPTYPPDTFTGVLVHAQAMEALGTDGGALPVRSVNLAAKVFLEGPYNNTTNEMNVALSAAVPTTSPYLENPRTVGSIPANVVDWVLVQLRSAADGATAASHSALLRKDGRLVEDDGSSEEIVVAANAGDYYVVIKHRNHLAIMSATPPALGRGAPLLYDFTTSNDKFYGAGGAKEVAPNVWGMWSGDIDQDRSVANADYTIWYEAARTGSAGYQPSDINFDREVTTTDHTLWHNNARAGAVSTVP
jgi:hypothetical protein